RTSPTRRGRSPARSSTSTEGENAVMVPSMVPAAAQNVASARISVQRSKEKPPASLRLTEGQWFAARIVRAVLFQLSYPPVSRSVEGDPETVNWSAPPSGAEAIRAVLLSHPRHLRSGGREVGLGAREIAHLPLGEAAAVEGMRLARI